MAKYVVNLRKLERHEVEANSKEEAIQKVYCLSTYGITWDYAEAEECMDFDGSIPDDIKDLINMGIFTEDEALKRLKAQKETN